LFGGMGWVRYDATQQANLCAAISATIPGQGVTYSCNPNYTISMLGAVTRWTPVNNLTFSAEAIWTHLTTGFAGFSTFSPGAPFGVTPLAFKAQDTASLNVRVQRNF
jgi:hypothetical protein